MTSASTTTTVDEEMYSACHSDAEEVRVYDHFYFYLVLYITHTSALYIIRDVKQ